MTRKTIKSLVLFFAAALFVLGGCEKEEMVQSNQQNTQINSPGFNISYTIQDNVLIFETIEDYENAIQHTLANDQFDREENSDFVSMAKHYAAKGKKANIPIEEPNFSRMLNPEGIIGIAEHFFKIDMKNNRVYVITKPENCQEYVQAISELKKGKSDSKVQIFSTNENVLNELYNFEVPDKTSYCRHRKIGPFSLPAGVAGERIYWKNVYFKSGIYNSLYVKMWSENGNAYDLKIRIKSGSFWKNKRDNDYSISGTWSGGSSVSKTVYSSWRRLTNYKVDADFIYTAPSWYATSSFTRNENNYCLY
jgi:hypothetical protein